MTALLSQPDASGYDWENSLKSRYSLKSLLGLMTGLAVLLAAFLWFGQLTVTIRNSGTQTLLDLKVIVSGQVVSCGDISSGATRRFSINPLDESHVEVSYRLADGSNHHHSISSYLLSSSCGNIDVEIAKDKLVHSADKTRMMIFW